MYNVHIFNCVIEFHLILMGWSGVNILTIIPVYTGAYAGVLKT